jgi:hypothetical protein
LLPATANNKDRVDACAHDGLLGASAQSTPLALGKATPDTKTLIVGQRVLEALRFDLALGADLLGIAG